MKKLPLMFLCLLSITSCHNELEFDNNEFQKEYSVSKNSNLVLKKKFSKALAKVLDESQEARNLIKNEALKKIDYDYDVLYSLINEKELSNGTTLEQLLLKYIDLSDLKAIKEGIPTLTIFVPSLPQNSFSAETWNTEKDIPIVAIRTFEVNNVPMIEADGEEWSLESHKTPIYPVVVVKENERISFAKPISLKSSTYNTADIIFIDEIFNNSVKMPINMTKGRYSDTNSDQKSEGNNRQNSSGRPNTSGNKTALPKEMNKVMKAYEIFKGTNNWHRDYIYYNLTTNATKGIASKNIMEHIVGFELINPDGSNDAKAVINKICDQSNDPKATGATRGALWTDGELEFKIKCYVASTTGIGSEIVKYMRFKPEQLFYPETKMQGNTPGRDRPYIIAGKFGLNQKVYVNLPLFEWSLDVISPSIKINIEEVDFQETIRQSSSITTEFASNFEYNYSTGETYKLGFKYGASEKKSRTVLYEVSTTKGNDELGEVVVNFGDDIIRSSNFNVYSTTYFLDYNTKYNSGWYRIYIAPKEL